MRWRVVATLTAVGALAAGCLERSPTRESCSGDPSGGDPAGAVAVQPASSSAKFEDAQVVSWSQGVLEANAARLLLVVCNTDAASIHPAAVTAGGAPLELVVAQDAPSFGALSVWMLPGVATGSYLIEAVYPSPVPGLARSLVLEQVAAEVPVQLFVGGSHAGGGAFSVGSRAGDLPLALVSWGNNQSTSWLGGELELWDDTDPGPANSLGGAAATLPGAPVVDFAWQTTSGSSTTGAHLGLNVRRAP